MRPTGRAGDEGRPALRAPPDPYQPATPAGKINLTDPDSRNVKTACGWVQGYNAQATVTAEQIGIDAEVTVDSPDLGHLEPMVDAAERAATFRNSLHARSKRRLRVGRLRDPRPRLVQTAHR